MPKILSAYLDLLRFAAALLVFIVHANYERFTDGLPALWRVAGLGNDAVMIFFVLSGFVIAYVSETREKGVAIYFSARLARLWSVTVPALALTLVLDYTGKQLSPAMYDGSWFQDSNPIFRTIANLFFFNEIWFWSIRPFSNGPYWSIGYEFWYYVIFASTLFLKGSTQKITIASLAIFIGPKILLLFPVWWVGVWAYRTSLANEISAKLATALFIGTILTYAALRISGAIDHLDGIVQSTFGKTFATDNLRWSQYFLSSYLIGLLLAVNFVAARRLSKELTNAKVPLERTITYLAGFTFSLYLFHYPLLQFLAAVCDFYAIERLKLPIVIFGTLCIVWLIGSWAERQKHPIRRLLLNIILQQREAKDSVPRSDG